MSILPAAEHKPTYVQQMFNRIAPTYDLLNDCISMGMHRQWKEKACQALRLLPGDRVLDVCTGTGDLVKPLLKHVGPNGHVVGLDFSESMLEVARKRYSGTPQVNFQQGDALNLPFEDRSFDAAIVSFGLRNVADVGRALSEMARVIKPGGWVVNLDTSPDPALPGFKFYFSKVMPVIGRALSRDDKAYGYLSESTKHFITPKALCQHFENAGLTQISHQDLAFGSVSLQSGQKPGE